MRFFRPLHPIIPLMNNVLYRTIRCFTVLCLWTFTASFSVAQQNLWQSSSQAIDESLVPAVVSYQRSISIAESAIAGLAAGETIALELLPGEVREFEILSTRNYLNGDTGFSGVANDGGSTAMLSLIVSEQSVVASINAGSSSYSVRALPSAEGYSGILYSQDGMGTVLPVDDGGMASDPVSPFAIQNDEPAEVLAISGNDVTIVQTLSASTEVVGQQVDINVSVTNNTASTLSGEQLSVLFVLDSAELVSSSAGCTTGNVGSNFSLICTLPDTAPSAASSIDYSVRLTDNSYPFISSGVFVGDPFGDHVRNDDFVFVVRDTLTDSDGDGQSDFNEDIVGTDPNSASSVLASGTDSEIDLMFLYTPKFVSDIGGITPETKINELVEITNGYYANSQIDVTFRPVIYREVNHVVSNLNSSFSAIQAASGEFSFVNDTRSAVGADIVVLIDGLFSSDSACGLGTTPGIGFEGEFFHPNISNPELYVTMYTNGFPQGGGSGCSDETMAHEFGHNHGLNHSHRESGAEATFSWAFGHGVDGSFATIMANTSLYPGSEDVLFFSNPESTNCNGLPCGVSRSDVEQGADAVFTVNHTRFQIAARRTSRFLPITSTSGSSNLTMYGAATLSSSPDNPQSSFNSTDSLDVRATLGIPSEHQGSVGETYVVISVDGTGLFFRDANGDYQSWDGNLETLQSNITARPLNATEELVAFENFVPSTVGVSAANLTVFFAYAIPGTEVFVYSSSGVPVSIQP